MKKQEIIILNNGIAMPALGLGVFLAKENETKQAVETALANGYRLIDTAAIYGNEEQVGQGIKASGVAREELFITTKLWITDYGYDQALKAFDTSLEKLGLDYIDLYLLHWPAPSDFENTIASWHALEHLLEQGKVRAIGVCNFKRNHLEELISKSTVTPALNQVELHPYFAQPDINTVDTDRGIMTQAWSPIGGALTYHPAERALPHVLEHGTITAIAAAHGKTPAQVIIRWHLQHGRSAIPKSVHVNRIVENFNVFDFYLTDGQMQTIDALDDGMRVGPDPDDYGLEYIEKKK
jgi:2,5-diketo-D-gluconate reductase A